MPLTPGEVIAGKYAIIAEIGRGAYGRVYRALDQALRRDVAIKELRKGEGEMGAGTFSEYERRFEQEARIQARFNHPNIAQVYELLRVGDDRLYLVMEYAHGGSLRERIEAGPLPVTDAVRMMTDLLAALAAVHADPRDIIHRDVKPSNVLLTRDGRAKLADFGVAQVGDTTADRDKTDKPHPGTALYMSPEQAASSAYLYASSDVYSAGCVLFQMLTGVPYKHAKRDKKSLVSLRPDAPPWLVELTMRALDEDEAARPQSGSEFGALLAAQVAQAAAQREAEASARQRADQEQARLLAAQAAKEKAAREAARREAEQAAAQVALEAQRRADAERIERERQQSMEAERRKPREAAEQRRLARQRALARMAKPALTAAAVLSLVALALLVWQPWRAPAPQAAQAPATSIPAPTDAPAPPAAEGFTPVAWNTVTVEQPASDAQVHAVSTLVRLDAATPTATSAGKPKVTATLPSSSRAVAPIDTLTLELAPGVPLELVRVPEGEFLMGSDPSKDPAASDTEFPQHRLYLQEYWIGKYEVTNAQYAAFLAASGHNSDFWVNPGKGYEIYPAVRLSLIDAEAFAEWASTRTGRKIRLPSEAEWEKAARGTDGRIYPWGNEAPYDLLANFDYEVMGVSAVGSYPRGESPYGTLDMAGNAWEWTISSPAAYPYNHLDGREKPATDRDKVLRGGSFEHGASGVRCAFRSAYLATQSYIAVGFRVASSNE